MTYANPAIIKNNESYPDGLGIYMDNTAIGENYKSYGPKLKVLKDYYMEPISRQLANPEIRFVTLKNQWEEETAMLSSITEISMHPAYQQIIGMGQTAIPLIMSQLIKKPGHWFWALKSITGEDPVLQEQRGRLKEMTGAWLKWGKEKGYIA
jgi:hypothetical protein